MSASMKQTGQFFSNDTPKTAKGAFALARALEAGRQTQKAKAVIQHAWENYAMEAKLQDAYVKKYGNVIKSGTRKRLREMLWQQNSGQVRGLFPYLTAQDQALAKACLALYEGKDGVDPLIAKTASPESTCGIVTELATTDSEKLSPSEYATVTLIYFPSSEVVNV